MRDFLPKTRWPVRSPVTGKRGEEVCLFSSEPPAHTLSLYELYYQKINLYYSFSRSLDLDFDEPWVYAARKQVSEEINRLL